MSKLKTLTWPKVILFGDSITQVRHAQSCLKTLLYCLSRAALLATAASRVGINETSADTFSFHCNRMVGVQSSPTI